MSNAPADPRRPAAAVIPGQQLPYPARQPDMLNENDGDADDTRRIRVNCVVPGPGWTPNIPGTMSVAEVEHFGHYLMDNGLTRAEYDWFMRGEPPGYQVMGNDDYGRNECILTPDGRSLIAEDVSGWYLMTKEYYQRYRRPVMHTETNVFDDAEAPTWLWKQWINVLPVRAPIVLVAQVCLRRAIE